MQIQLTNEGFYDTVISVNQYIQFIVRNMMPTKLIQVNNFSLFRYTLLLASIY